MQGLMERLGFPIPQWIVRRRVRMTRETTSDKDNFRILIEGRDPDDKNVPFSLFKYIQMNCEDEKEQQIKNEPFIFQISKKNPHPITIQLHFFEHYNEIPFNLNYSSVENIPGKDEFYLFYNPMIGQWRQTKKDNDFPV
jgi:hypothetical protein